MLIFFNLLVNFILVFFNIDEWKGLFIFNLIVFFVFVFLYFIIVFFIFLFLLDIIICLGEL